MRGRYFRYLFENVEGSLFHIGSVYDKERQMATNYIYMVGGYYRNTRSKRESGNFTRHNAIPAVIDILVLGGYTVQDVNKLVHIVKTHRIKVMVLPYLAPIQRLALMEEVGEGIPLAEEIHHFLKEPYLYLRNAGIGQIYFLYGNGESMARSPEEMEQGVHFEPVSTQAGKLIQMMEGASIPVVRAGYIIENNWLFYFGTYGLDIHELSKFTREYFSHMENIRAASDNRDEDYAEQTRRLLQEYLRKFGSSSATTVTMFEGPLYAYPGENDSFMTEKELGETEYCRKWKGQKDIGCMIKCMHGKDYDVMQYHRKSSGQEARFGMLMLGNANLNRYYSDIVKRFRLIWSRIRGICVPNCGSGEDWNHQILSLFASEDRLYWVCSKQDITSVGMAGDIVFSSSYNRFVLLDNHCACCISGYIIPKEDLE